MATLGELKEKAIKDFFKAWRDIRSYDLELFMAETYQKIDMGDVVIDEKGSDIPKKPDYGVPCEMVGCQGLLSTYCCSCPYDQFDKTCPYI